MGGIVRSIFGGGSSKQQSTQSSNQQSTQNSLNASRSDQYQESGNSALQYLMEALSPTVKTGSNATGTIAALLGQGGDADGANNAFKNYLGSTGYNFMLDQGSKAITGSSAAKGLLNSGATLKALTSYGQNLGSQYFNNFLTQLQGLAGAGSTAANTISGAGNYSKGASSSASLGTSSGQSTGTSTAQSTGSSVDNGKGIFGSLFPGGLSDQRIKVDARAVGRNRQGLTVYDFEFTRMPGVRHIGVMAEEVALLVPEALGGLNRSGYETVDYSKIEPLASRPFTPPVTEEAFHG